jgi:hypothetical protein
LKPITTYILSSGFFLLLAGCFEAPDFADTPKITFENVEFKQGSTDFDSLIISINYEDGDGDLGLDEDFDTDPRYIPGRFALFEDDSFVTIKDIGQPLPGISSFTEVPGFERPYDCVNWVEVPFNNNSKDTLLFIPNENTFNFFVKFLFRDKGADDSVPFEEFNWVTEVDPIACGSPINGRFPVLRDLSESDAPIEGLIRYSFISQGLVFLFEDKELKLEVSIQDRKLQRSNSVTITGNKDANSDATGFTLAGIQVN